MKIISLFILLLAIGNLCLAQATKFSPINFDRDWLFFLGDKNDGESPSTNDKSWQSVDLPHDWDISQKISPKAAMGGGGGFYPAGIGWYRKYFDITATEAKQKCSLEFEGVYMGATVYVNGNKAAWQPYGYTTFTVELSPYLHAGKNLVAVKVDNSVQKNSRWYSGSGIYRHVWMRISGDVHLIPSSVFHYTVEASAEKALLKSTATVTNEGKANAMGMLRTTILGSNGKIVAQKESPVTIEKGKETEVSQEITIGNPELWGPENPKLCKAVTTLSIAGKTVDENTVKIGVRKLLWSNKGMTINGKVYKLNGGCIHHDNGILGAAAFDRAEIRKVALIKASGFNEIRTSHNPPSPALLNACDSLGVLVMDEAFDCWAKGKNKYDYSIYFKEWWEKDIDAFVKRDRNHPCVVFWSTGNEIPHSFDPLVGGEYCDKLADRFRLLDPSRPVTQGLLGLPKNAQDSVVIMKQRKALDVVGCNYNMGALIKDEKNFPERVVVGTESSPDNGQAFNMWKNVQYNDFVLGDNVWTAQDYLGEVGVGRWFFEKDSTEPQDKPRMDKPGRNFVMHGNDRLFPWHGAQPGDLDILGNRKPTAHYRNIIWDKGEKLYMGVRQPKIVNGDTLHVVGWGIYPVYECWTFPGQEGQKYDVEVYSRYERVALYLNDKLVETKDLSEKNGFRATFSVAYEPGTLKAVGIKEGKEVAEFVLRTAFAPASIRLTADKQTIANDGQDLVFVNVEVVDDKGEIVPFASNPIHFKISGSAVIQALGNANLKSTDVYVGVDCKVFNGRALVVVKGNRFKAASAITLEASGDGLIGGKVGIKGL